MKLLFFLALNISFFSLLAEEAVFRRIQAHLLIHDPVSACSEAALAIQKFPSEPSLWKAYVIALARCRNEKGMLHAWKQYEALQPDSSKEIEILEEMAWSILENASLADSPLIRLQGLLAASGCEEMRGVEIISRMMKDPNGHVRAAAVHIASSRKDAILCERALHLFKHEANRAVRLEAIQAVGKMKIASAKSDLLSLIANEDVDDEEKAVATQALVTLIDTLAIQEVQSLAVSQSPGLRQLACEAVAFFDIQEASEILCSLLQDYSGRVRESALYALGILRVSTCEQISIATMAAQLLLDQDPKVAIAAAWLLTLHDPPKGGEAFKPWLCHHRQEIRLLASAALAMTGAYGCEAMHVHLRTHRDPYVRMNLALGLIGQRRAIKESCEELHTGFLNLTERWAGYENRTFQAIAPGRLKQTKSLLFHPDVENLQIRLEVVNILAIIQYENAKELIMQFLENTRWGTCGTASALLLTRGDEAALQLVRALLTHPKEHQRIQAALILALWGKDPEALDVLKKAYPKASRVIKEKILEGIGRIGAKTELSFLTECLQEPSQTLRVLAASALLACVNS